MVEVADLMTQPRFACIILCSHATVSLNIAWTSKPSSLSFTLKLQYT